MVACRFDTTCSENWPAGRAGHGSVFDSKRHLVWLFGGYNTYYPYLSTDGLGSNYGVGSLGTGGFVPYPGFNYFLNDLWYFNLSTGYWTQVPYPNDMLVPEPRCDHLLLLVNDTLVMHGK